MSDLARVQRRCDVGGARVVRGRCAVCSLEVSIRSKD